MNINIDHNNPSGETHNTPGTLSYFGTRGLQSHRVKHALGSVTHFTFTTKNMTVWVIVPNCSSIISVLLVSDRCPWMSHSATSLM